MKLKVRKELRPKAIENLRKLLTREFYLRVVNEIEIAVQESLPNATFENVELGFDYLNNYLKEMSDQGIPLTDAISATKKRMAYFSDLYYDYASAIILPMMANDLATASYSFKLSLDYHDINCDWSIENNYFHVPEEELNRILNILVDFTE